MDPFYDIYQNKYFTLKDKLYVNLVAKNLTRYIGNLTYNLNNSTINLTIFRKAEEKTKLGYLVSLHALQHLKPDKIILVENNGEKTYYIEWKNLFFKADNPWKLRPKGGWEDQMIIPDAYWNEIKQPLNLINL